MNNEEIAKHTGVPIERVNQIEAEEFDRISKAVAPCPVFVEAADHERIKVERDGIAKQLADLVRYAANLDDDNDSLREQLASAKEASDDKFADFRKRLGIPVGVGLTDSITDLATARRELQQTQTKLKFMAQAEVDLVNTQEELKQEKERAYAASGILSDICGSLRNQDKTLPLPDQVRDRIATLYAQLLQCQAACVKIREVADVVEIYRSINESVGTERMWSEFQDALSTSPATALAEALESALKEGFEIKDRIWPSNSHNAWLASDTRKKLP